MKSYVPYYENLTSLAEKKAAVVGRFGNSKGYIVLGSLDNPDLTIMSKREQHVMVIGTTGSGKTRSLIMPSILQCASQGCSMFINDPKGEIYSALATTLEKQYDYEVKMIDLRDYSNSQDSINVFEDIDKKYHSGDRVQMDEAQSMIDELLAPEPTNSYADPFWRMSASYLLKSIVFLLLSLNIRLTSKAIVETAVYIMHDKVEVKEFIQKTNPEHKIRIGLDYVLNNAEDTSRCVYTEFLTIMNKFIATDGISDVVDSSTFSVQDLQDKKLVIFLISRDESSGSYPLISFLFHSFYLSLISIASKNPDKSLKRNVTFFLDEFSNFVPIESIGSMITASRSRNIRFVLGIQDVYQLNHIYGENKATTIINNCGVKVIFGTNDTDYRNKLIAAYGPSLSMQDFNCMEQGTALVLIDRALPMFSRFRDISEYDIPYLNEPRPIVKKVKRRSKKFKVKLMEIIKKDKRDEESKERESFIKFKPTEPGMSEDELKNFLDGLNLDSDDPDFDPDDLDDDDDDDDFEIDFSGIDAFLDSPDDDD